MNPSAMARDFWQLAVMERAWGQEGAFDLVNACWWTVRW